MINKHLFALKQAKYDGIFMKSTTTLRGELKAVQEEREGTIIHSLTVKFSDYNSIDTSGDKMLRGAFTSSFDKAKTSNRKIAFLWQHDRKDPIGRIVDFWEDNDGAYVKAELSDFDSVPNAKRAWAQVKDKVINQASFGYSYVWDALRYIAPEKETEDGYFLVGEVNLHEVSLVTMGANENTEVLNVEDAQKALVRSFFKKEKVKEALLRLDDIEVIEFLKTLGIELNIKNPVKKGLFGRK